MTSQTATVFQRFILPGLAFKAVVIGGGYATGRELAEFFLVPGGPKGGLFGMLLAAAIWSAACVATFLIAHRARIYDYRSFFQEILGRFWWAYEITYILFMILVLSVFGAAAGTIGATLLGWPQWLGTALLAAAIAAASSLGNQSLEALFRWVSPALYIVFAILAVVAMTKFGGRIADAFALPAKPGWVLGGVTYAGYNVVAAVVVLPVVRHLQSDRDAVVAGLMTGPIAILPAVMLFCGMAAFAEQSAVAILPSDVLLERIGSPLFRALFQMIIFLALLETGAALVHAVNERIAAGLPARAVFGTRARLAVTGALLAGSMVVATVVGFVTLIAQGYTMIAYALIAVYLVPLATIGVFRIVRNRDTLPVE